MESICKSCALFSTENHLDSEDDESGSDGKGLFWGLINVNGDQISPSGLYSSYIMQAIININLECHSVATLVVPKMAPKMKNPISNSGSGEWCTTLFFPVSQDIWIVPTSAALKTAPKTKNPISNLGSGEWCTTLFHPVSQDVWIGKNQQSGLCITCLSIFLANAYLD